MRMTEFEREIKFILSTKRPPAIRKYYESINEHLKDRRFRPTYHFQASKITAKVHNNKSDARFKSTSRVSVASRLSGCCLVAVR